MSLGGRAHVGPFEVFLLDHVGRREARIDATFERRSEAIAAAKQVYAEISDPSISVHVRRATEAPIGKGPKLS